MSRSAIRVLLAALLGVQGMAFAAADTFPIREFRLEGISAVATSDVLGRLQALVGEARTPEDLQTAREIITGIYADAGFEAVDVQVPAQDVTAGVLRLVVVETRLGQVKVQAGQHFDADNARRSLPALREGEVLNTTALRESLAQANRHEAKQTHVRLAPAAAGKVDATVSVRDRNPQRIGLLVDNAGSVRNDRLRTGVEYRHSNLFNRDHVLDLQYLTEPTNIQDVTIFGAAYRVPFYAAGGVLDVTLGYSDVDSGTVGTIFTISGRGTTVGLRYTLDIPPLASLQQQLGLGAELRDYRNSVQFLGAGPSLTPDIVLHPLSLHWQGALDWRAGSSTFNVSASHNIAGGADGEQPSFSASRAGSDAEYDILRYGIAHTLPVGASMALRLALNGQQTSDLLVSGEQFGIGGAASVRGFDERALIDDNGRRAVAEWQLPAWEPSFAGGAQWRPRLFIDHGQLSRNRPTVVERQDAELTSAGAGASLGYGNWLFIDLDGGIAVHGNGIKDEGDGFLHARLQAIF